MTDKHIGIESHNDPMDDVSTGQPLWYWALPKESKREVLEERARKAGTTYGEDLSRVGCTEKGEIDPAAYKVEVDRSGPRMGARKRRRFEKRVMALARGER